ncbi:hypothetical protein [Nitratireductor luteus]|uniref:hypothetical protein n=1 Tax=Nitratireductor luteus TaxID=2976980 RepID=UPI00223FB2B8|nr:hypothetical protein [Nitratireductor luteus]
MINRAEANSDNGKKAADDHERNWEVYINHRKHIDELRTNQINTFDKAILTMSTGALGLSILLISTFAQKGNLVDTKSLVISWSLFLACITFNLFSYGTSALAAASVIKKMDKEMLKGKLSTDEGGLWLHLTRALNGFAIVFFAAGAIFLLVFAMANARSAEAQAEKQTAVVDDGDIVWPLPTDEGYPPDETGVTPISPPMLPIPLPQPAPKPETEPTQDGENLE